MQAQLKTYDLKDQDQVYFLHIPHTAGTSFTKVLKSNFDLDRVYPDSFLRTLIETPPDRLARYQLFAGHFFYSLHLRLPSMPSYLTMLRDPVERTISHYAFVKRYPGHYLHRKVQAQSLLDFVCDPETCLLVENLQTQHLTLDVDFRSIALMMSPAEFDNSGFEYALKFVGPHDRSDRSLLEKAKTRLREFAFVGLAERFQESMSLLSFIFGWRPTAEVERLNVSPNRPKANEIPPGTLEAIRERTQLDAELYTYATALFENYLAQMNHALLEEHYERRVIVRSPPARSVTLDFGRFIQGVGWHPAERSVDRGNFRWSGPYTRSTVEVSLLPQNDMIIEFRVIYVIADDILDSLELMVNDEAIELARRHDNKGIVFRGLVSRKVVAKLGGFCRLTFQVNRTEFVEGIDPNGLDSRAIGLAYGWLQLRPQRRFLLTI